MSHTETLPRRLTYRELFSELMRLEALPEARRMAGLMIELMARNLGRHYQKLRNALLGREQ